MKSIDRLRVVTLTVLITVLLLSLFDNSTFISKGHSYELVKSAMFNQTCKHLKYSDSELEKCKKAMSINNTNK